MDMIFSALQLQMKFLKHRVALYKVFVSLTKAFDSINMEVVWTILSKERCHPHFVRMFTL